MKKKKGSLKKFMPVPAAAMFALAASGAHAQTTPIFDATFPASWSGTGTTVTDQSSAGDTGYQNGTATYSTTAVPSGATGGSMALSGAGGIKVTGPSGQDSLLNNSAVAAAGGFTYNIDFLWNGTGATGSTVEKLIDYSGTESLQLTGATGGSATLQMQFGNDAGAEAIPVSTTISANNWYDVTLTFDTQGNSLNNGDISGLANLYVNGALVDSADATKGTYGDNLSRPTAIGELGYGVTSAYTGFDGDIYSASIDLGVQPVPEPSTLALSLLGGLGMMGMMWKARRRKA